MIHPGHAGRFVVGQYIRAYDFPVVHNSYIEGRIIDANGRMPGDQPVPCYVVAITRRYLDGKDCTTLGNVGYVAHHSMPLESEDRICEIPAPEGS